MATTTTTQVTSAQTEFFDKVLLVRALPLLVHHRFGQVRPFPLRNGKQIKFRRYGSLATKTVALTEGITPIDDQLSITDITATLAQYGGFATLSDVLTDTNVEPVMTETAELHGEQAGDSVDQIYRDAIAGGTTIQYADGSARSAVTSTVSAVMLDKVERTLANNKAKKFTDVIKGRDAVGTTPVWRAYWGVCHPDVHYDLKGLTGWTPVADYPDPSNAVEGEVGAYKTIRFIETTNGKVFADSGSATGAGTTRKSTTGANCDVYGTLIFGRDAYGFCPLQAGGRKLNKTNIEFLHQKPGGPSDPLEQRETLGWKCMTVAKILNDNFMLRLETAASI